MNPGIASFLIANAGNHQACSTSLAVSRIRTFLPTGNIYMLVGFQQVVFNACRVNAGVRVAPLRGYPHEDC